VEGQPVIGEELVGRRGIAGSLPYADLPVEIGWHLLIPCAGRVSTSIQLFMRTVIASFILAFCMTTLVGARQANEAAKEISTNLRARIERSPRLPFRGVIFTAQPPKAGWESGAVSGVATAGKDMIMKYSGVTQLTRYSF
jgi:hypothetical protein